MLRIDRTAMHEVDADTTSARVDLVPVTPSRQPRTPATGRLPRPDPSFITQLIATAEQLPQTRNLRRAAPSDATSAYSAGLQPARRTGKTWQVI
jgi:hypothetical protein